MPAKQHKGAQAAEETSASAGSKEGQGRDKKKKPEQERSGLLGYVRPKERWSFFLVFFIAVLFWVCALNDPCNVGKGQKRDCGFPGITAMECRTSACFAKGGGLQKKKVTIKREKGVKFGLKAEKDKAVDWLFISEVKDGPVTEHNAALPAESDELVRVGDSISSINGRSGSKEMKKILTSTDTLSVTLELQRSKLTGVLRSWLHTSAQPGAVETVLTSSGFQAWLRSFLAFGSAGSFLWFFSGYPLGSLPIYYFGSSAVASWYLVRCCHDDSAGRGVPHCYKGARPKLEQALSEAFRRTREAALDFATQPADYLRWFFVLEL